MTLKIRALELRVVTSSQRFGRLLRFENGLTILHAENSSGKSTCLQSIIYALGLEGMFGPSHDVPLPHAMTDWIEGPDGTPSPVLESHVALELENGQGERLTLWRQVKGTASRHLIRTQGGAALTAPGKSYIPRDYYVREPGAATESSGFHTALAKFAGIELPVVPRFDGKEGPLYFEAVSPLFYVEQKMGYGAIEGRFPTHLRIREIAPRAVEFVLNLDAYRVSVRRNALKVADADLRAKWSGAVARVDAVGRAAGGIVRNLPSAPVAEWPPKPPVEFVLPSDDAWVGIDQLLGRLKSEVATLEATPVARVGESTQQTKDKLAGLERDLAREELRARDFIGELERERADQRRATAQLEAIEVDLRRTKDAEKLRALGSELGVEVADGTCPTCHQDVAGVLVEEPPTTRNIMSIGANVALLEEQRQLYRFIESQAKEAVLAREQQLVAINARTNELRDSVRTLRKSLVSDDRLPSTTAMEARVRLEHRIRTIESAARQGEEYLNVLAALSDTWRIHLSELASANAEATSSADENKLATFEKSVQDQLVEYDLTSVDPRGITISRDSYRATFGGLELQFDLSGSDLTRVVWAYRLGLLEVARQNRTNHLGFVIFDEPRQQATAADAFNAFLRRAANSLKFKQQVIVATSEKLEKLGVDLTGFPNSYTRIDGRILAPI
jgi:hypothetical protein